MWILLFHILHSIDYWVRKVRSWATSAVQFAVKWILWLIFYVLHFKLNWPITSNEFSIQEKYIFSSSGTNFSEISLHISFKCSMCFLLNFPPSIVHTSANSFCTVKIRYRLEIDILGEELVTSASFFGKKPKAYYSAYFVSLWVNDWKGNLILRSAAILMEYLDYETLQNCWYTYLINNSNFWKDSTRTLGIDLHSSIESPGGISNQFILVA